MNSISLYLMVFAANFAVASVVAVWLPDYRHFLILEDSLVENLTALIFLMAFFVGLIVVVKRSGNRFFVAIITASSLLCFLDEQSFGERLFALEMPTFYGVKIDAVHDLVSLGYAYINNPASSDPPVLFALASVLALVAAVIAVKYRYVIIRTLTLSQYRQAYGFALIFAALVTASIVIDLEIVRSNILLYIEELFELNAAIALLFCVWSLRAENHKERPA